MNVKEYISSGIVESYVLGLLPDAERQAFEETCAQYPEVLSARQAFEDALEDQLMQDAIPAPANIRQHLFDKINNTALEDTNKETVEERTPVRSMGVWKWVAAAALILLAGAVYWAYDTNARYKSLQADNAALQERYRQTSDQLAASQSGALPTSPKSDFKMAAIHEGQDVSASIYWDTVSKDVYLMIKNMPQPVSGKQYQLWALLPEEGAAPVDLGMVALKQERLLYRMKNVRNAKAFAITLEPVGGSPAPTSSPMVSSQPSNL